MTCLVVGLGCLRPTVTHGRARRRHGLGKGEHRLLPCDETVTGGQSGWTRRDTRGASSLGYGDKNVTRRGTKDSKGQRKREVCQHHERGLLNATESLEQHEGKSECDMQEKCGGQHKSTTSLNRPCRLLAACRVLTLHFKKRGQRLRMSSAGDMLYADACGAMDELAKTQQD